MGNFGEFEYWFAIIKVVTIVAFILVGLGLIFGVGPARAIGFSNLIAHGGFLPNGLKGVWLALSLTLTSYMGVEIIGVTAGEALQPEKTIPRAMRTVTLRLILFYVLSITVMLSMTPWDTMGSGITGSPFVLAFAKVGIPYAAGIMNLVVITAALSSANTNLYLTSRTLFSLSHDGYVPKALGSLGRNGVPYVALMVSTAGMAAAILLAIFAPGRAFLLLYGVAVAGMFFVWMRHPARSPVFSPLDRTSARRTAPNPPSFLALLADRGPGRSRRHCHQHLLCGGPGILGSEFHTIPAGDYNPLPDADAKEPKHTEERSERNFSTPKND